MAKTAVLSWVQPTTRVDGSVLKDTDIAYTDVSLSAAGAAAVSLGHVPAGVVSFTQTELEPGDYAFIITVVDKQVPPKTSAPLTVSFNVPVPDLAAPSAPINGIVQLI